MSLSENLRKKGNLVLFNIDFHQYKQNLKTQLMKTDLIIHIKLLCIIIRNE